SSRRRHTKFSRDWSSDVCSSDLSAHPDLRGKEVKGQLYTVILRKPEHVKHYAYVWYLEDIQLKIDDLIVIFYDLPEAKEKHELAIAKYKRDLVPYTESCRYYFEGGEILSGGATDDCSFIIVKDAGNKIKQRVQKILRGTLQV